MELSAQGPNGGCFPAAFPALEWAGRSSPGPWPRQEESCRTPSSLRVGSYVTRQNQRVQRWAPCPHPLLGPHGQVTFGSPSSFLSTLQNS